MNIEKLEQKSDKELEQYFSCARNQKCPPSMKKGLYEKLNINLNKPFWQSPSIVISGLSLVFISSFVLKMNLDISRDNQNLESAQAELQIAMQYMNEISMKSLSAINNKGIKPALVKPLARSVALL